MTTKARDEIKKALGSPGRFGTGKTGVFLVTWGEAKATSWDKWKRRFQRQLGNAHVLKTHKSIVESFVNTSDVCVWLAADTSFVSELASAEPAPGGGKGGRGEHRLLIFDHVEPSTHYLLNSYFRHVLPASNTVKMLEMDELMDVMVAPDRDDLFIGGIVDEDQNAVVLYRGSLEPLVVPLSWFKGGPDSPQPNPRKLGIEDHGQTVKLGNFEAASDAILYEFDRDFRKRARLKEVELDQSFGGSLRRLRLQRGVSRSEFPGITAKTIARLERNEIDKPQARTLEVVAKRLGVDVEELDSF